MVTFSHVNAQQFKDKRPIGHIAHLWNQFKSINTFAQSYDHYITLNWRRKKRSQPWVSFTKDALCQVWLKLAQWFWERRFWNFFNVSLLFCNYLPIEKGVALHLNKLESPWSKDALCQVWKLKFAQLFWKRKL